MTYEFVLTERQLKLLRARGYTVTCDLCKKAFVKGDTVLSKRNKRTRHFHVSCFKNLYYSAEKRT